MKRGEGIEQANIILNAYKRATKKRREMLVLLEAATEEVSVSEGIIIITLGCNGKSYITASVDSYRIIAEFEAIKHSILHNDPPEEDEDND